MSYQQFTAAQLADLESRVFVLDGPDGTGKSTATASVASSLRAGLWKAPSPRAFGQACREWYLNEPWERERNLLASAADWRDILYRASVSLIPIVIDRGHCPSSFAYQGQGDERLLLLAQQLLITNLPRLRTVVLLPPVEEALRRLAGRPEKADALDAPDVVRRTYQHYEAALPYFVDRIPTLIIREVLPSEEIARRAERFFRS